LRSPVGMLGTTRDACKAVPHAGCKRTVAEATADGETREGSAKGDSEAASAAEHKTYKIHKQEL
jgi:hypothetical protein